MPLRPSSCPNMHDIRKWKAKSIEVTSWKDNTEEENVVTVIFTFEKWFDEIQNIFIMYIDFSHRFYHANISYTTFSLSLMLSLSLSSNHYSFSTDLFAGSQYTWKLLFIFLTPDSSPLRIKIFARKCFTNNHCLHCLPNYIKIYSLLYGLFCNFFISNHHVLSLSHIKPLFM